MKIPTRHSFIVLILLMEACLLIKGEKCWIPMLCDDQPTWRELMKGHCTKEDEKTLDALTERLDRMKNGLNQLKKVMEKSETNSVPPSVIGVTTTSQGNKVKKTSLARTSNVPATSPWSTKEVFLSTVRPQTTKGEQSTGVKETTTFSVVGVEETTRPSVADVKKTTAPSVVAVGVKETSTPSVVSVKETTTPSVADTSKTTTPTVAGVNETTTSSVAGVKETTTPSVTDTNKTTAPTVVGVKETTTPSVVSVKETTTPSVADTNKTTTPTVAGVKETTTSPVVGVKETTTSPVVGVKETTTSSVVGVKGTTPSSVVGVKGTTTSSVVGVKVTTTSPVVGVKETTTSSVVGVKGTTTSSVVGVKETTTPTVVGVKETTTQQGYKDKKIFSARTSIVPATSPWSTKDAFLSIVRPQTTKGEQSTENEATTEDMTSVIVATQGLSTEECGLFYNSKCFQAIVYKARNVSLSVAETLCGNKLANIYDVTHYNLVLDYLRSMIPDGRSWIWIRAGMTYKNGQLYSTTGQAMSLSAQVWRENYPNSDASYTTVVVDVNQDSKDEDQGIYNTPTSNVYHGAICEN
ncbi:uncharacterized protein LOC120329604 [Styela clava]